MIKLIDLLKEIKINDPTINYKSVWKLFTEIFYNDIDYNIEYKATFMVDIFRRYGYDETIHSSMITDFLSKTSQHNLIKIYKELKNMKV